MQILLRRKILLIFLGIFIGIILLELFLTIAGIIYRNYRLDKKLYIDTGKNIIKILCLGDSFTFGEGAPKGFSYPAQLENLLNNNFRDKLRFVVYNAGVPGSNSSYLSNHLKENIDKYKPDIIIILTGANNNCDFRESNYFLFMKSPLKKYLYRLDAFLSNLKSYKLIKTTFINLFFKINQKLSKFKFKENNKKINIMSNYKNKEEIPLEVKEKINKHFEMAIAYEEKRDIVSAIDECKKIIELNPNEVNAYIFLGRLYIHRAPFFLKDALPLAIITLRKALDIEPSNLEAHWELFNAYYRYGMKNLALEQLKIIHKLNPYDRTALQLLSFGIPDYKDMEIFKQMLKFDLQNIIEFVLSKKIKLVLQSYPFYSFEGLLREIAKKYNVPFVDNEEIFKKIQKENPDKNYYAQDGHLNAEGYRVMAENVYNVLVNEVLKIK